MMRSGRTLLALTSALILPLVPHAQTSSANLGIFDHQSDVGSVTPPGTAAYDASTGTYTLTAAGANLWEKTDAFHFVWKKMSGDFALTADIEFRDTAGEHSPHRKALLMIRQTLAPDSIYIDAAQHGAGLTAIQDRRTEGATTDDIELNIAPPRQVRIEKRGDIVTMYLVEASDPAGTPLHPVGASIQLHLQEPFYVGLGVCSHDASKVETAVFSHVALEPLTADPPSASLALYSTLQIVNTDADYAHAQVIDSAQGHFEAPNWTHDGKTLIFDQDGKIMTVSAAGGTPQRLYIGDATRCNGSHGLSPDGQSLAISCSTPGKPESRVYIVPLSGGGPRLVTENPNSYWHSWTPDARTIIFTRPNLGSPHRGSGNIYAISVDDGPETPLTTGTGVNDDPDCSPDGRYIYFNSDRSGSMQIWRMHPDGSAPEQITSDDRVNWTPHVSPDGKSIVYISYEPGTTGHPANQPIELRLLSLAHRTSRVLVHLIGGSGTMNVPSWAPDSRQLAFVSYQLLPVEQPVAVH
jgi:Tol biopolymer transport system component